MNKKPRQKTITYYDWHGEDGVEQFLVRKGFSNGDIEKLWGFMCNYCEIKNYHYLHLYTKLAQHDIDGGQYSKEIVNMLSVLNKELGDEYGLVCLFIW